MPKIRITHIPDEELLEYKSGGKHWIPKHLKKGRCTPLGNPDCRPGTPQYNLAKTFKKHHGFHAMGGVQKFDGGGYVNGVWVPSQDSPESSSMLKEYGMDTQSLDTEMLNRHNKALEIENGLKNRESTVTQNPYEGQKSLDNYNPITQFKGGYSTPEGTFDASGKKIAGPYGSSLNRPKSFDYNKTIGVVGSLAQAVPALYNLSTTDRQFDTENYGKVIPTLPSYDEAYKNLKEGYYQNKKDIKDISGGNTALTLNNLQRNKTGYNRDFAQLNEQATNAISGTINQAKYFNKNLEKEGIVNTLANKAKMMDQRRVDQNTVASVAANTSRDYRAGKMDENSASLINDMFTNYKLDRSNPSHWKWVYEQLNKKTV